MSNMRRRKGNGVSSDHQDIEGQNKCLPWERNAEEETTLAQCFSAIQTVLHPERRFIHIWNKIFVASCVIAVSVDPLFFYIHVINEEKKCIRFDKTLTITAICLRSVTDLVYVLNIILQFLTPYKDEWLLRGYGITELVTNAWEIAWRYLLRYFVIDILAILPIPQVVMLIILPKIRGSKSLNKRKWLNFVVLLQYGPRFFRIFLSRQQLMTAARNIPINLLGKVAFNLAMYILVSHVLGAFWYFFSIERETACWHVACENHIGCVSNFFNCDTSLGNFTFLNGLCPANTTNTTLFDFGIFREALQSGILESTDFPKKFLHCFWWGLRNLSSLGQNLQTSTYFWENCFAVFISLFGLLVFLIFIGNLQTDIQDNGRSDKIAQKTDYILQIQDNGRSDKIAQKTDYILQIQDNGRMDKIAQKTDDIIQMITRRMRVIERNIELWMDRNKLPKYINREILSIVQHLLVENIDVDVESLFPHLPIELRKDIKRFLCMPLLRKVPMFQNIGEHLLQSICDCLKPVYYNEHNYIVREGEPLDAMLFITQGIVWTYKTSDGERSGSLCAQCLEKGNFYGEELLDWGFKPSSSPDLSNIPNSPKTVKTHIKVEAYALLANDLKTIVTRKQIMAAFAFQAACRRHQVKKPENSSQLSKGRDGN